LRSRSSSRRTERAVICPTDSAERKTPFPLIEGSN
jgi:hypothetical protein